MVQYEPNCKHLLTSHWTTYSAQTANTELFNSSPEALALRKRSQQSALDMLELTQAQRDSAQIPPIYSYDRLTITDQALVKRLARFYNVSKENARVQVLRPGEVVPVHLDDLWGGYMSAVDPGASGGPFSADDVDRFRKDPYFVKRFLIFVEDWAPGQCILFGKTAVTGWTQGDAISWDWTTDCHATVNAGYWPRALIRLTGIDGTKL